MWICSDLPFWKYCVREEMDIMLRYSLCELCIIRRNTSTRMDININWIMRESNEDRSIITEIHQREQQNSFQFLRWWWNGHINVDFFLTLTICFKNSLWVIHIHNIVDTVISPFCCKYFNFAFLDGQNVFFFLFKQIINAC